VNLIPNPIPHWQALMDRTCCTHKQSESRTTRYLGLRRTGERERVRDRRRGEGERRRGLRLRDRRGERERERERPYLSRSRWRLAIARSGATVTQLLCDPLPMQNVLKHRTRQKRGWHFATQAFSTKCTPECRPHLSACGTKDRAIGDLGEAHPASYETFLLMNTSLCYHRKRP
jgi:hypothetical protein